MNTTENRNIEEHLAYANDIRSMAVSHQQEMMPLLKTIEQLQNDLCTAIDQLNAVRQENADKDRTIILLQDRLAKLESRTTQFFCRITQAAYDKGMAHTVEEELRSAAKGTAAKLIAALRTNEALGYIDTKNLSSAELYDLLNRHFKLNYSLRNFTMARNQT